MASGYKLSFTAEDIDERLRKAGEAILTTPQGLTLEQQAQARQNIGVEEDWQLLCDTTTTEEIVNFAIDTDMDGNPFSCRKIVAEMICPDSLPQGVNLYFGNALELWGGRPYMGAGFTSWMNPKRFVFRIELVKNKFAVLSFNNRVEENFMSGNGADTAIMYSGVEDISSLTKFFIANATFPVGTRFLVWGCKA